MSSRQEAAWHALIEVGERLPEGWTLVGGQLIHLHCVERGALSPRPTDDGDAGLDVRARPEILAEFTGVLNDIGFVPDTATWRGHQHRWTRGDAAIDVLIPRFLGERAEARRGVGGGTTLAAPGTQGALNRTEMVRVTVAGVTGTVPRPTLPGAIAAKAAALEIADDPRWPRHVQDLAILSTLIRRDDSFDDYTSREMARVGNAIGRTVVDPSIVAAIEGATDGLAQLRRVLNNVERRRQAGASGPTSGL